jgi:hypothetical protein
MSLVRLKYAGRSTYPTSAKLHGGSLALAGGGFWSRVGDQFKKRFLGKGMRGAGFWSNLGNSFKNLFTKTNDFLKKTKLVSRVASIIPHPAASAIGTAAEMLGYGRYHNRVKGYKRKTGAVRKYTRRVPRKKCMCGRGRGCRC